MGNEDFEEALYQYGILIRKLLGADKELDEVHESLRVERVYTYTSIDKRIWSEIHDKIAQITEVNEELNKLLHYILGINENLQITIEARTRV